MDKMSLHPTGSGPSHVEINGVSVPVLRCDVQMPGVIECEKRPAPESEVEVVFQVAFDVNGRLLAINPRRRLCLN